MHREASRGCSGSGKRESRPRRPALTNPLPDARHRRPMLQQVEANCGAASQQLTVDAGYWSQGNAAYGAERGVDAHIATKRLKPARKRPRPEGGCRRAWMRRGVCGGSPALATEHTRRPEEGRPCVDRLGRQYTPSLTRSATGSSTHSPDRTEGEGRRKVALHRCSASLSRHTPSRSSAARDLAGDR